MTGMEWLAQSAVKGTLILAAGFAAAAGLRRASAAVRHFVWAAMFAALLILPVAIALTPKWRWIPKATPAVFSTIGGITTANGAVVASNNPRSAQPATSTFPLVWTLWITWITGCGMVTARFLLGAAGTRR